MTDRVTATQAVIEAAEEWARVCPPYLPYVDHPLMKAVEALTEATSPDLDAQIAEALPCLGDNPDGPCNNVECPAYNRPAVRDLIVSLLTEERLARLSAGEQVAEMRYRQGFEQAREQAATVADGFRCGGCGMDGKAGTAIRSLTPDTERKG